MSIDRDITRELINYDKKIFSYPSAFASENSIEMQIPFIQYFFRDASIVLAALGDNIGENYKTIGNAIAHVLKERKDYIIVASTDMHHFLPYDETLAIDQKTISIMEKLDPALLYTENAIEGHGLLCGVGAVCAVMQAAKKLGADKLKVLKYANSGDTSGDKRSVVGYVSAAIARGGDSAETGKTAGKVKPEEGMLNKEQKKELLKIAREAIATYMVERKVIEPKVADPALKKELGAFVTLHNHGRLRGCIGNIVGHGPLYLTVRDMAIEAACRDSRFFFNPVTIAELKDIDLEISVLSPMRLVKDPNMIEAGRHGVLVKRGFNQGVYLPQVAVEQGWTREEFMDSLCGEKAGMPKDSWKKGGCEMYIFEAEVFGEKDE